MREVFDIRAFDNAFCDSIDILIVRIKDGRRYIASPVSVQEVEHLPGHKAEPSIRLERDQAQMLMNELWRCGVRPLDGNSSMAHVDAMKCHLEDMRRLVFDKAAQ